MMFLIRKLKEEAENDFEEWQESRPSVEKGNRKPNEFNGNVTNYVRHNFTNYDEIISENEGKSGNARCPR